MTHPCMSPTTVTGALTWTTFDSRIRTSFVFSHISLSSASWRSCLRSNCWIQASRSKGAIALRDQGGEAAISPEAAVVTCLLRMPCSKSNSPLSTQSKRATRGSPAYKSYHSSPDLFVSPVKVQCVSLRSHHRT